MAMKKKTSPAKSSATKVNKTAWIRSQPTTLSAKEVVSKAKEQGITLSVAQVYTARSTGKKTAASGAVRGAGKAGKAAKLASTVRTDSDVERALRRIVLSVGLPKVESYLAELKRSAGL